jgi:hypothetical protein
VINGTIYFTFTGYGKREIAHLDIDTTNGMQRRQNYGHAIVRLYLKFAEEKYAKLG